MTFCSGSAPGAQHASIHAGAGFSRADFRWYLLT
jgi:hypothetical protein